MPRPSNTEIPIDISFSEDRGHDKRDWTRCNPCKYVNVICPSASILRTRQASGPGKREERGARIPSLSELPSHANIGQCCSNIVLVCSLHERNVLTVAVTDQ